MMRLIAAYTDVEHNTVEWMHPMILAAKANSEDTPRWEEAMNGPNKAGYWEAMRSELATLTGPKEAWDVVDREDFLVHGHFVANDTRMVLFASLKIVSVFVVIVSWKVSTTSTRLLLL
jgi:hypothetical protein